MTFYTKTQLPLIERIERIAKMKFKKTGTPQPVDIVRASARDIVISLKSVKDAVLPHFMDIAKEMIDSEGNPAKALAKALAYISGNTEKISQRSLLNSSEGYITYVLKSPVEFTAMGYVFNFLRGFAPEKVVSEVKGMRKFGKNVAAFDVPDAFREEMDKSIEDIKQQAGRSKGFSLEVATSLEELEEADEEKRPARTEEEEEVDEMVKRDAYKRKRDLEVFVGGLPYNADENEVTEFFRSKKVTTCATRILRCNIPHNSAEQGESRGVAFVLCVDDKSVKRALTLNG